MKYKGIWGRVNSYTLNHVTENKPIRCERQCHLMCAVSPNSGNASVQFTKIETIHLHGNTISISAKLLVCELLDNRDETAHALYILILIRDQLRKMQLEGLRLRIEPVISRPTLYRPIRATEAIAIALSLAV